MMMPQSCRAVFSGLFVLVFGVGAAKLSGAAEPSSGAKAAVSIPQRVPWATSNVRGTPDPPPPFRAARVFPKIRFQRPTVITSAPGTDRFFIAEQDGKIFSIPNDPACEQPDLMLDAHALVDQLNQQGEDLSLEAVYGLTFDPDFARNRFCYVCYVVRWKDQKRGQHPDGTRVSRLTVTTTDPPRCELESERLVISWLQGGHNGGCLKFGPDGCLYISTGDGGFAFPPDGRNSGQDVSNLLSAILRIDVHHSAGERPYAIPPDNPFVSLDGARGEIWAYGLRNPWKMSFDRKSGELWVGDVGWELWELVYRVNKGDNYGWSLVEGRQPVHTERKRGPTPIVPPTVEISHTDGASVTGGFVYRGQKFPELEGTYIFGDWETRWIWGVHWDGHTLGPRRDLVDPTVRIVDFAEDKDGELFLLDYDDGTISTLERNDVDPSHRRFPLRLSETGLFASTAAHEPAPGVIPFAINVEQWADHATAERFIAVPGSDPIRWHAASKIIEGSMFSRAMDYPKDTVLAKTISLEMRQDQPASRRRVETQMLHFDGRFWRGYSYAWNDEQTDAELVAADGRNRSFDVVDPHAPGGKRHHNWRFSSRVECIRCHNPWTEYALAFNVPQLNRDCAGGSGSGNQIRLFRQIGLLHDVVVEPDPEDPFATVEPPKSEEQLPRLADPFDPDADLALRGRSYLHANCAHCHRFNGGGASYINLQFDLALGKTGALDVRPTQGSFEIHDAKILAPGDPYQSVLYFRMAKLGAGHMPHLGSKLVDERGLRLIHDWIRQLPVRQADAEKIDRLIALEESAVLAMEAQDRPKTVWRLAKSIAEKNERKQPTDDDRRQAAARADREAAERVTQRATERRGLIDDLLSSTSRAVMLLRAIQHDRLPAPIREQAIAAAIQNPALQIRDLFELLIPDEQRTQRLGDVIQPDDILKLTGDLGRGRTLFHATAGVGCRNCHRIGEAGTELGPDLNQIGKKYSRPQLLETILQPSKNVDPKYQAWLVETTAGKVLAGLLVEKTAETVVLKDAQNKLIQLASSDIEQMLPQQKSLMPELLLRDLTAQQVADLLAYLASLK